MAQRLGCKACEPHTCTCEKTVDAWGLHGLSCRKSSPRQQRHSSMNDILWRAVKRAQILATKELANLVLQSEKRPYGSTSITWSRSKLGMSCPRPLCRITHWRHCRRGRCSGEPGSGQQNRQVRWTGQHAHLLPSCRTKRSYQWNHWAVELVQEIGRRAN